MKGVWLSLALISTLLLSGCQSGPGDRNGQFSYAVPRQQRDAQDAEKERPADGARQAEAREPNASEKPEQREPKALEGSATTSPPEADRSATAETGLLRREPTSKPQTSTAREPQTDPSAREAEDAARLSLPRLPAAGTVRTGEAPSGSSEPSSASGPTAEKPETPSTPTADRTGASVQWPGTLQLPEPPEATESREPPEPTEPATQASPTENETRQSSSVAQTDGQPSDDERSDAQAPTQPPAEAASAAPRGGRSTAEGREDAATAGQESNRSATAPTSASAPTSATAPNTEQETTREGGTETQDPQEPQRPQAPASPASPAEPAEPQAPSRATGDGEPAESAGNNRENAETATQRATGQAAAGNQRGAADQPTAAANQRAAGDQRGAAEQPSQAAAGNQPTAGDQRGNQRGRTEAEGASEEQVETRVGTQFDIHLPGSGWIYLGAGTSRENVRFRGRERTDSGTRFRFVAETPGSYDLQFQQQNMSAGDIEQRSVSVVARPERSAGDSGAAQAETDGAGRDSSGTSDGTSTGAATASPEGQEPAGAEVGALRGRSPQPRSAFEEAYALLEEGRRQEALRRFTELYRGPNAQVALDIAELAESLDRAEMARRYYGRAAEATGEGEIRARAERGLFRAAVERQEWERAAAYAETALEQGESPSPEVLLRVGERQAEQNPAGAIKSFEHYLNAVEEAPEKDRVHYMLGRLYERRSPSRNMERALKNYEVVTNDYPLSDYFDRSMQRIRYIERYYVDIR